MFHSQNVFHKINVSALNSEIPEKLIMMVDNDFKIDLAIEGNFPRYSSTTKDYLAITDNDNSTRWKSDGPNSWLEIDLGLQKYLCTADIAWYKGNGRSYNFVISISTDGLSYREVFRGKSSGTSMGLEKYIVDMPARYVRVNVSGNSVNNIASITQFNVNAHSSSPSNQTSCNYLKIKGLKASNDNNYENIMLSKRKSVLRTFYYSTDSIKIFNGSTNQYDPRIYPGGTYVDVRANFATSVLAEFRSHSVGRPQ